MKKRNALLGVTLLLAVLGSACAGKRSANAQPEPENVTIAVQNNNWNTVIVYAVSHGLTLRLGEVPTGNTVNLKTPRGMDPTVSDFRLLVDPIGGVQSYVTPRIPLGLGQTVHLRVENDLRQTSFSVS
jgi:hypothetical protein